MRIAVVGSGISGLASAWLLSRRHDVTLFEAGDYLGGHTHTHAVVVDEQPLSVDTGFIVFNPSHYPLLSRLFDELGVASQPTTMSFSVHNEQSGLEYNAGTLDGLFCQRRNLVSPRFLGMVRDILRFYRESPALLSEPGPGPSLGAYMAHHRYGQAFRDDHLVPMASALWSSPARTILDFPAKHLVQFMANHQMLQVEGRPQWRVVSGGSASYVRALADAWRVDSRLRCPVLAIERDGSGVTVRSRAGGERFGHVVLACHSDQALALLADATEAERAVLGAIPYQRNTMVLHTDPRLLPRRRKAWAAWNAHVPAGPGAECTVSYCMNILQGLSARTPIVVTLNRDAAVDPSHVLRTATYQHPVFTAGAVAAQQRKSEIQGRGHTWFAGAYWGWGFHEDGMRSAVEVATALGVAWPGAGEATAAPAGIQQVAA